MSLYRDRIVVATVDELLSYHDEHFIHAAYHALLGRAPDEIGLAYYTKQLRDGTSKIQIVYQMRSGKEGRGRVASISGLDEAIKRRRWLKIPILRFLLSSWYDDGYTGKKLRALENQLYRFAEVASQRHDQINAAINRLAQHIVAPAPNAFVADNNTGQHANDNAVTVIEGKANCPGFHSDDYDAESINYYGYIRAESGLGSACRGYISALKHIGKNVSSINLSCGLREVDFSVQDMANTSAMFNIVHMNADSISYFFNEKGANCLDGQYNIGLWVWELAAFRPDWFLSFEPFQEIWVPSEFCRQSISAISPVPVYVIPHIVADTEHNQQTNSRGHFNLPDGAFVYGYMFDCSSSIARKNPFALIEAFKRAFTKNENVVLLLKLSNKDHDPGLYDVIRSAIDRTNILTIERSMDEIELRKYFEAIDCYVSPHRSEGFGLTIAEAMLAGKPVIATNYGGSTDFVKSEIAYPVNFDLVTLNEQHGPYLPGYIWAEPDLDHLVERLKEVYEHPDIARFRGAAARDFINEQYSVDRVAALMNDRFKAILNTSARLSNE